MDITEYIQEGIACIKPVYKNGLGNVTQIITAPGQSYIDKRVTKTVIKNMAKHFGIDLTAIRKNYGKIIGQKNSVPIPFKRNLVFIPLKMRKPLARNDGTLGFLNLDCLQELTQDEADGELFLVLKNGIKIKCLMRKNTVKKHIRNAKIIRRYYLKTNFELDYPSNVIKEVKSEYLKPATKADIALLAKELMKLKEKLS